MTVRLGVPDELPAEIPVAHGPLYRPCCQGIRSIQIFEKGHLGDASRSRGSQLERAAANAHNRVVSWSYPDVFSHLRCLGRSLYG